MTTRARGRSLGTVAVALLASASMLACGGGDGGDEAGGAAQQRTAPQQEAGQQPAADTSGLTQRTGVPFEPVSSTRDTLPLLLIMRNLEKNMAAVQAGIWRGNYDVIQEAARAMADHAKIPSREIERIRTALGDEGLKGFVAADRCWHQKATELAKVAGERDMRRIVQLTTELLQRCSSCHQDYRQPLRQGPEW